MSSWCQNCEDWIFKCSCREREKISSLESELQDVKDQLREAVEVIRYIRDSHVSKPICERAEQFLTKHKLNSEEGR